MKAQLLELDKFLSDHASLWRPQPFKEERPAWCQDYPELASHLLNLDDLALDSLERDFNALLALIIHYIPSLSHLETLCTLSQSTTTAQVLSESGFGWEVPGRKKRQIEFFTQAITSIGLPLLEWCGGKGHLGRVLGALWQQPVETVEWNAQLCDEGRRLSARAGVKQIFHVADALDVQTLKYLENKQLVALHACGDLHRHLIHGVQTHMVEALDIAPCCYHLGRHGQYIPFNTDLDLSLSRDDLRLAVTGSETAPRAQLVLRDREMAWKLGYDLLRKQHKPEGPHRNIRSIDKQWLKLSFAEFCQKLAQRESYEFPGTLDWQNIEGQGWQRQGEVMRLNLLRMLFRRAIEIWLVLDMATFLEAKGYSVTVSEFCASSITPRNVLLSARTANIT